MRPLNILLIIIGIGSLILIGVLIFSGIGMGKRADTQNLSTKEKIHSKTSENKTNLLTTDTIPQGKFEYELYFAEFNGRMPNQSCDIEIKGNKIIVSQNKNTHLTGGKIIFNGLILKHKSGEWILADEKEDIQADEIGGCTEIPIIDFDKKLIIWC